MMTTHRLKATFVFAPAALLVHCSSSSSSTTGEHPGDAAVVDGSTAPDAPAGEEAGTDGGAADAPPSSDAPTIDDAPVYFDQVAPTPPGSWANVTHNLAGMASECGNLTLVSSHPSHDILFAGVALHGIWASTDGAASWHAIGTGSGSATITNRPSSILYDPAHTDFFWESGIYNAGGVYSTSDDGTTFLALGDSHHNDSVSVDFTDAKRQTLLAGTHEQKQVLYLSTNGGAAWTDIGMHLPSGTNFCTQPLVIDAMTFLVGCSGWGGGTSGIFRSTDAGATWKSVTDAQASGRPLSASDGSIYWAIAGDNGLVKSGDKGQTWTQVAAGGVLRTVTPIELPDHRIAIAGQQKVLVSPDGGKTWNPVGDAMPFTPIALAYSAFRRAFVISHDDCNNNVPADAIAEAGWDYTKN